VKFLGLRVHLDSGLTSRRSEQP